MSGVGMSMCMGTLWMEVWTVDSPICKIGGLGGGGGVVFFFFFSSRRRHTRLVRDWSSDVCSSDLPYRDGVSGVSPLGFIVLQHVSPLLTLSTRLLWL